MQALILATVKNIFSKFGFHITCLALAAIAVLYAQNAKATKLAIEVENRQLAANIRIYQIQAAQDKIALMARTAKQAELEQQAEQLKKDLEDLYQNDKDAKAWSVTPVPDGVLKRLR